MNRDLWWHTRTTAEVLGREDMALTEEQQEIIDDPLDTDLIMVIAFSGAAKTTTMKAGTHQKKRGLDLAYNRPAAAAAQVIFPANTVCETVHALAYRTAHHAESRRGYADRRSSDRTAHMHACAEPLLRYSPQAATAVRLRYTLAFVGGIDGYNFLYQMRDPLVRQFRSFAEMAHYAEATEDPETNRLVNVVSLYGDDISGLIPRLAALSDGARTDRRLDAGHGSQIERPGPLSRVVMANDSRFRRRRSGPAEGQSIWPTSLSRARSIRLGQTACFASGFSPYRRGNMPMRKTTAFRRMADHVHSNRAVESEVESQEI